MQDIHTHRTNLKKGELDANLNWQNFFHTKLFFKKSTINQAVVADTFNPIIGEAELGGSLSLRPTGAVFQRTNPVSKNQKQNYKKKKSIVW